jgi:phosphoenolpyruvate synthase/pyruvate phosphate dikinase
VPVDRIQLEQTNVLNLRDVKAADSGVICGPKAANLGQLKSIFPDHVVEGFVIPFGIFRKHLDNEMPGTGTSYWNYLNDTYAKASEMRKANKSTDEIDAYQLKRLSVLKKAVENMKLNDDFVAQIEAEFKKVFGTPLGTQAVFLRSDTNMEDLKEFTGAGLNLTLFNVLSKEDILNGIKEVWASPYTERSLRWRQKYLLNPEYVFPSIVVIPGVNNDYSGVVITQGINEGSKADMTVAFSRGVGGAVDGQAAETRLITKNGNKLLSPSREPTYVYLPESGDTKIGYTTFENPILNEQNMQTIRDLVKEVRVKVPERTDPDYKGAYDMEMGFKNNKLWLFQIRPFVENKKAKSSDYLKSISPTINYNKKISLTEKI